MDTKKTSPPLGTPEHLLAYIELLRQHAEEFQRAVDDEVRNTRALRDELLVRQAKRLGADK